MLNKLISITKNYLKKYINKIIFTVKKKFLKNKFNQLNRYYKKIYSQNGEDGVINHIFKQIGFNNKISVEIGAHWHECNSRNLIENFGFKGFIIDYSLSKKSNLKNVIFLKEWVTRDNINQIIGEQISGQIDFLSIDVDGIDLYLIDAIKIINPRVVCLEYCASLGKDISATVKYKDNFDRLREHPSGMYANASLKACINVLKKKGYKFIGTVYGLNAFFVRSDINLNKLRELNIYEGFEPHYGRTYLNNISQKEQEEILRNLSWTPVSSKGFIGINEN